MSPISLLHVFPGFAVGGAQVRAMRLLEALGDEFEHAVVSLNGDRSGYELLDERARLAWIEPPPRAGSLRTVLALARLVHTRRPSVVLTYNWGAIDAVVASRLVRARALVHHEDGFGPDEVLVRNPKRGRFRRWVLPRAHRVVVPSHVLLRIALDEWRLPRALVELVPNGVDLVRFAPAVDARERLALRESLHIPADAFVAVAVGGLRPEKRPDRLLEAVALVPGAHAIVVGDGPWRARLEERAQSSDLAGRIHLCGVQRDPRVHVQAADAFVLPSDTEQMPIAMVEAMAAGLPVAATDVGDVTVILPSEQRPCVVPVGSGDTAARDLAAVLAGLAADPARRRSLGALNMQRAAQNYGFDGMVARYRELYRAAARRGHKP